jgi:NitT/TauT family transport system permease protein
MAQQAHKRIISTSKPVFTIFEGVHYRLNWLQFAVGGLFIVAWYLLTLDSTNAFVVAPPQAVAKQFLVALGDGTLLRHTGTTLLEIGVGLFFGVGAAFTLGVLIARSRILERAIGPYAVGFQAVPIVAIAPVLIRIFGPGLATNGLISAFIVFFPMLVSTIVGLRSVDPDLREMMRSLSATPWQIFTKLELPGALPVLFGGLKISAILAVVGTVVGEALNSQAGLGYMIYLARYVYDTSSVYVGIFTLTALALALYELVARIERRALRWQQIGR